MIASPRLNVLVVARDREDAEFARSVLQDSGDRVGLAHDVMDALSKLTQASFDMALVSLSLPRGDGLALVHHIRALYPSIDVIVMAAEAEMRDTAHAMALGVLQAVLQPLTGDALLVAADRARERRLLLAERARLVAEGESSRRRTATYERCAAFVTETDVESVAERILDACAGEVEILAGAFFAPHEGASDQLQRIASRGDKESLAREIDAAPEAVESPIDLVRRDGKRIVLTLADEAELHGVIHLLVADTQTLDAELRAAFEVIIALGKAAVTAARKVDAIARMGIKDRDTSAYTFAYFGDVAGREIDRATRHGRRFALLTLSLDGTEAFAEMRGRRAVDELRRWVTEAVLLSVRDSDVLARVDDEELYTLLPETGLLGALATRRRVRSMLATHPEIGPLISTGVIEAVVGVAVFPTDGGDLGRLLRVSRRRADDSRFGIWRRLGLANKDFVEIVDRLLDLPASEWAHGSTGGAAFTPGTGKTRRLDDGGAAEDTGLSRHASMPRALLSRCGSTLLTDAIATRVRGSFYAAGDSALEEAFETLAPELDRRRARAWVLAPNETSSGRFTLPVDDPRLQGRSLLLGLTEIGGYALLGNPFGEDRLRVYHTSDLFFVDGLVAALQSAYHLQPEIG